MSAVLIKQGRVEYLSYAMVLWSCVGKDAKSPAQLCVCYVLSWL